MSAYRNTIPDGVPYESLAEQVANLNEALARTAALHSARVAELLEANNREVEKRRIAERALEATSFQARVGHWMQACFGPAISADRLERGDRLLEEVLELLQSGGYPPERVAALTGYVWSRPAGEPPQEVGGVEVTLAAYCLAHGLNKHEAGETELARIWTKVEAIRAKQAAKPTGSALPQAWANSAPAQEPVAVPAEELKESVAKLLWERFAPLYYVEWEGETHKAEYTSAAGDVLAMLAAADSGTGEQKLQAEQQRRSWARGEMLMAIPQANPELVDAVAAQHPAQQPFGAAEADELAEILGDILREAISERGMGWRPLAGNAPGHGHETPGVWDDDNGPLAGKPCKWCATWKRGVDTLQARAKRTAKQKEA